MSVIYILITVSLIIAIVFFIAFVSAVRSGQYDDAVTPSIRMLFENKSTNNNLSDPKENGIDQTSKPLEKP